MVRTGERAHEDTARFCIDLHPERDRVRVVPVGELDVATVGALEARLHELREAGVARIVLDLRELAFVSSAGLRLLVVEHERARRDGRDFMLIAGSPAIQRVIEICGLVEHLSFAA
jgi:anti-anti-sigma factor